MADLSATPELSPSFLLSPTEPGAYLQASTAAGNGIYLVVWASFNNSGTKIVGVRVRAADGVVLDSSPLVIGANPSSPGEPAVAFDGTNFLVVWTSYQGPPRIVGARVRASDGAVLDTPPLWLSNAPTPAGMLPHLRPAIAFDGTGNYLVAWEGTIYVNGFYTGIAATRVRAADGAILDSYPVLVSPSGAGVQVAYSSGTFLVAWQSSGRVQAARVSTLTGQMLDTTPLLVAAAGANPAVAARDGEFLVLWKGSDNGLWARRLSAADGSKLGPADTFVGPAVAAPPTATFDGAEYWISWQGTREGVRKELITRMMAEVEPGAHAELVLGDVTDGSNAERGGVAAAGQGLVLAAYAMKDPVTGYSQVWMRLLKVERANISAELSPSPEQPDVTHSSHPAIAAGNGMYLVVWSQVSHTPTDHLEIVAARVSASDGTPLDASPLHLGDGSYYEYLPDVAFDGTNFLVVWTSLNQVRGTRVRASDGAVLDTPPLLLTLPSTTPNISTLGRNPSVTFDGTNYLVTWSGARVPNSAGQIINGMAGLHVRPSDGTPVESDLFMIAPIRIDEPYYNFTPDVATADGSGISLLVWTRDGQIEAARISASGQVLDATPLALGPTSSISDMTHAVAAHGDEFLVLWRGSEGGLWARRIRASDGAKLGTANLFVGPGLQGTPSATFDGANYRVSWPALRGGVNQLLSTRITPTGVIEADAQMVLSPLNSGTDVSLGARIAAAGPGHFMADYLQHDPAVGDRTRMRPVSE